MDQIGRNRKANEQNRVKPRPKNVSAREILSIATSCSAPPAASFDHEHTRRGAEVGSPVVTSGLLP
jgi:hypothetical protein